MRERRAADPVAMAARAREYRQNHRPAVRAATRRWEKAHPDEHRAAKRRRYHADVEHSRELQNAWRNSHPEVVIERNAQRREEIKAQGLYAWYRHGLTPAMRWELLARQNNRCAICERELTDSIHPCVDHDHATMKIRGILCKRCNLWLGITERRREAIDRYLDDTSQHLDPQPRRRYQKDQAAAFMAAAQTS